MKVRELIELLKQSNPDNEVVVPTYNDGRMGSQPCIEIDRVYDGFDWDHGNTFLVTKGNVVKNSMHPRMKIEGKF